MPRLQEQELRLEVVLDDQASEQLAALRGEMQKLVGGETQGGIEKLHKQAEALQKKLIPLFGQFSKVTDSIQILTRGLGPMGFAVTAIGAAAGGVALNLDRFMTSITAVLQLRRETGIPGATIKAISEVLNLARVPAEQINATIQALSRNINEFVRDDSPLIVRLREHFAKAGDGGVKER